MSDILFADVGDPVFSFFVLSEKEPPYLWGTRDTSKSYECEVKMYDVVVYSDHAILACDPIEAGERLKRIFAGRLRNALAGPSILA